MFAGYLPRMAYVLKCVFNCRPSSPKMTGRWMQLPALLKPGTQRG